MDEDTTLGHLHPSDKETPSLTSSRADELVIEAINHYHAGRTADAEHHYRSALALRPHHAVALYGWGLLQHTQGRLAGAIEAYRHAIAARPDFADAYINLGTVVLALGQSEEAVALYRHAIAISPDNAMAHGNLGKTLQDLGRIEEAIVAYHAGIARQPDNVAIHVNLGAALIEQRAWDDAVTVMRRAVALQPSNAMAQANLGTALLSLGRHDEAMAACRMAAALQLHGAAIHSSLGGAMLELGALPEAVALCRQAIALDPALAAAHFNLSHAFKAMNRLPEAALAAREAIALCPGSAEYHFHLAHILLLQGDLEAGWDEYEWRLRLPDFAWIGGLLGARPRPLWLGEDIADKTILVYSEQGFGDIIQFARYLPMVVPRARRVIIATHPPLHRLLETIEGITVVTVQEVPLQDFDVQCPLLSLPRAFMTRLDSVPASVPYLRSDPSEQAHWDRRIRGSGLRVGIVWAGNPATQRDRFRSPGLASVMPLFSVPGVDFVVLQVGAGRKDCDAAPLPPHVLDLGSEVVDLADTSAIMAGLDLMISSCTGPLHLAGALGVPAWAMIPFAPHFPWLLDRTDTLWYPSMHLYRQEQPGRDWSGVVGRIAADLVALVATKARPARPFPTGSRHPASVPAGLSHGPVAGLGDETSVSRDTAGLLRHLAPGRETGGFNELAPCRDALMLYNRNDIYIGASLRKYGEFSGGETALFGIIVQPGMTVLDIGANIGAHTIELSRLTGPSGAVHAFEPQRLVFQVLCANVALNSRTNVFTYHAAVGACVGTLLVPLLDPKRANNYGALSLPGAQCGETVPVLTIDSMGIAACHIMKVDLEGMEAEALLGAAATIARFRPVLYVENDRADRSADLISLIQSYGYRLYWHLPPLYSPTNFRGDPENMFGNTISANMLCIPAEVPQSALTGLREVTGPSDQWYQS
jgi:FkbM family methyltransferase